MKEAVAQEIKAILKSLVPDNDLSQANLSPELKAELAVYRALRPYICHCLTLNHDLNNPLAGILGYAEFILTEREKLDTETAENIDQIVMCAERIRKRLDELCEEKISLSEEIDLKSVTDAYQTVAINLSDRH